MAARCIAYLNKVTRYNFYALTYHLIAHVTYNALMTAYSFGPFNGNYCSATCRSNTIVPARS